MYERCGLQILEQLQEGWYSTYVVNKPAANIVPRLEDLLRQLISRGADDDQVSVTMVGALQSLPREFEQSIGPLLIRAQNEKGSTKG
jgi:hypothetical protein